MNKKSIFCKVFSFRCRSLSSVLGKFFKFEVFFVQKQSFQKLRFVQNHKDLFKRFDFEQILVFLTNCSEFWQTSSLQVFFLLILRFFSISVQKTIKIVCYLFLKILFLGTENVFFLLVSFSKHFLCTLGKEVVVITFRHRSSFSFF